MQVVERFYSLLAELLARPATLSVHGYRTYSLGREAIQVVSAVLHCRCTVFCMSFLPLPEMHRCTGVAGRCP
jgi:hypothetical protein